MGMGWLIISRMQMEMGSWIPAKRTGRSQTILVLKWSSPDRAPVQAFRKPGIFMKLRTRNSLNRKFSVGCVILASLVQSCTIASAAEDLPLEDRISKARIFAQPVVWTGQAKPNETESDALWQALEAVRTKGAEAGLPLVEDFIENHPD